MNIFKLLFLATGFMFSSIHCFDERADLEKQLETKGPKMNYIVEKQAKKLFI